MLEHQQLPDHPDSTSQSVTFLAEHINSLVAQGARVHTLVLWGTYDTMYFVELNYRDLASFAKHQVELRWDVLWNQDAQDLVSDIVEEGTGRAGEFYLSEVVARYASEIMGSQAAQRARREGLTTMQKGTTVIARATQDSAFRPVEGFDSRVLVAVPRGQDALDCRVRFVAIGGTGRPPLCLPPDTLHLMSQARASFQFIIAP